MFHNIKAVYLCAVLLSAFQCTHLRAQSPNADTKIKSDKHNHSSESTFFIEHQLVDKIYEQSSQADTSSSVSTKMNSTLATYFPKRLILTNRYFKGKYHTQLDPFPILLLHLERPISLFESWAPIIGIRAGLGYIQKNLYFENQSSQMIQDSVTLQWIPTEGYLRLPLSTSARTSVKPFADIGYGQHWIHQHGSIDGVEQDFRQRYVSYGLSIEFATAPNYGLSTSLHQEHGPQNRQGYNAYNIGIGFWATS